MNAAAPATAAVLGIGTELTTGQIANTNAAWISERISDLGISVVLHQTVADDRAAIRGALDACAAQATVLFVTGGLGPTTDDFTREVVADWTGEPLAFHEPSWQAILRRLQLAGVPVVESQKQQCWFPQGAECFEVLDNPAGTANAFTFVTNAGGNEAGNDTLVFVLPGPPREILAVWEHNRIEERIRTRVPGLVRRKLLTWECMGKSEAELGEITEKALAGSGLAIGYRAHRPYVQIKVWVNEGAESAATPWLDKLDAALKPWAITRQSTDLARELVIALARGEEVGILDSATGGILAQRLGSTLRRSEFGEQAKAVTLVTEWAISGSPEEYVQNTLAQADPEAITLIAAGFTEQGQWAIGLREGNALKVEPLRAPYRLSSPEFVERMRAMAAEIAIKRWTEWLKQSVQ